MSNSHVLSRYRHEPWAFHVHLSDWLKLTDSQQATIHRERSERSACLTRIFAERESKRPKRKSFLKVTRGVLQFRHPSQVTMNGGGGARGKVTGFSRGSKKRMFIRVFSWRRLPQWWQTFTFADDVLDRMSLESRARFTSKILKAFKEQLEDRYPDLEGIWRREWEDRKSGLLVGQYCPHFHMMFHLPGMTEDRYREISDELAVMWVRATGTKDPNAYKVALNDESAEWLHNGAKASFYTGKYMGKVQECFQDGEVQSLGRMWGKVGKTEFLEPVTREYSKNEEIWLKRFLKRFARASYRLRRTKDGGTFKRHKRFLQNIENFKTWVIIRQETVFDMLWWAWKQAEYSCPF